MKIWTVWKRICSGNGRIGIQIAAPDILHAIRYLTDGNYIMLDEIMEIERAHTLESNAAYLKNVIGINEAFK